MLLDLRAALSDSRVTQDELVLKRQIIPPILTSKLNKHADWRQVVLEIRHQRRTQTRSGALTAGQVHKLPSLQMKWCERPFTA